MKFKQLFTGSTTYISEDGKFSVRKRHYIWEAIKLDMVNGRPTETYIGYAGTMAGAKDLCKEASK